MKRIFSITIGVCLLVIAGTAGTTGQRDLGGDLADIAASSAKLSATEAKALQARFRYYPSSDTGLLRAPI